MAQVQRVNDLIGEISAASARADAGHRPGQRRGRQLDQVTQQNAALVEESAAAAEPAQQAAPLAQVVSAFKLGAADNAAHSGAGAPAMAAPPRAGRGLPAAPPLWAGRRPASRRFGCTEFAAAGAATTTSHGAVSCYQYSSCLPR